MILVKICFRLTGFMRIISVNDKAQVIDLADVDSAKYLKKILTLTLTKSNLRNNLIFHIPNIQPDINHEYFSNAPQIHL